MVLGPQQMPPQGARALVGALLGGRRGGPEVTATLDESQPGSVTLEFVNEGSETAIGLRCLYAVASGELSRRPLGNLPPAGTTTCNVEIAAHGTFQCVWAYEDEKHGTSLRSYDGSRKRLRRQKPGSEESFFRAVYA